MSCLCRKQQFKNSPRCGLRFDSSHRLLALIAGYGKPVGNMVMCFYSAKLFIGSSPIRAICGAYSNLFKTKFWYDFTFEKSVMERKRYSSMNRKQDYKDMEKWRKTCRKQNQRYYAKTSNLYSPRLWTAEEDAMVMEHNITDSELSVKIQRSVRAIQHRRHRLNNFES